MSKTGDFLLYFKQEKYEKRRGISPGFEGAPESRPAGFSRL
jgi:hypothetical protein